MVEKGEIAQNEQFHLFPHIFFAICVLDPFFFINPFIGIFKLSSAASLNLGWSHKGKWCIREWAIQDKTNFFFLIKLRNFRPVQRKRIR